MMLGQNSARKPTSLATGQAETRALQSAGFGARSVQESRKQWAIARHTRRSKPDGQRLFGGVFDRLRCIARPFPEA